MQKILEGTTDDINERLAAIPYVQDIFETHLNFSPIIWDALDPFFSNYDHILSNVPNLPCECIFLTYSDVQINRNSEQVNKICTYTDNIQEYKQSEYGGTNLRYTTGVKKALENRFIDKYTEYFDKANIRYIF